MKKNKGYKSALVLIGVLAVSCGGGLSVSRETEPAGGEVASGRGCVDRSGAADESGRSIGDFTLKDIDGKTHRLSDYLCDQVVVISFFATWCEPCKIELMALRDFYNENRDNGFTVLAVAIDEPETQGEVRSFAKQRRFDFPVLLDTELEASGLFNPKREAHYVVVIDKAPAVYWTHSGYLPGDGRRLQQVIRTAVDKHPEE